MSAKTSTDSSVHSRHSELPQMIGVIHLPALPGDPRWDGASFQSCYEGAMSDARSLLEGGIDGIIVENFGSAPFHKGDRSDPAPPHQLAALTLIAHELKKLSSSVRVGINCLRNDACAALGIAAVVGADFIRVNVLSGAYVTDQGIIEGEAVTVSRYRRLLGDDHVKIFADVLVKHAAPLAPLTPSQASLDTWKRGGADALIVTGTGTGAPVDPELLQEVSKATGDKVPVYIGSGLNMENVSELAPLASGVIVGTALKAGGELSAPVSEERVRSMRSALDRAWGLS